MNIVTSGATVLPILFGDGVFDSSFVCVGVKAETAMFNLLLHVHNHNHHFVSPSDVLTQMIAQHCLPNEVGV